MRTEILPVIGNGLTRALDVGRRVLGTFVEFVTTAFEILTKGGTTLGSEGWLSYNGPIVKALFRLRGIFKEAFAFIGAAATILWKGEEYTSGTGWLSENGVVVRNLVNIRNTFEAIGRFVKSNLTPVIAGLGAAFGALVLSGGNLPLAGLAGLTTGVVLALRNDEIRNALVDTIKGAVERARNLLANLINDDTLKRVAVSVLKVARTIGRVLGDALTDRRLVTAVAGIAAAAAAVAGAFVVGLGEGVISNIPELANLLGEALNAAATAAIGELISNPELAIGLAAAFFGARAAVRLIAGGKQAGRVIGQAITEGAVTAGNVAGGRRGLITGLFGGPTAVRRAAASAGEQYARTLSTAVRNELRVVRALGGQTPKNPLGIQQFPGEKFADQNKRLAASYKELRAETQRLGGELGTAAVGGVRLRDALGQIGSGRFREGFAQLGTAIRESGKSIATNAGIIAGGAFSASFIGQALFDIESSGSDKLASGLGLLATSIGTGAAIGGKAGIVAGAGVGLFGLVTSGLRANSEAAERARERIDEYAEAIRRASKEELPDLFETTVEDAALEELSNDAKNALSGIEFSFEDLGKAISDGTADDLIGPLDETVQRSKRWQTLA